MRNVEGEGRERECKTDCGESRTREQRAPTRRTGVEAIAQRIYIERARASERAREKDRERERQGESARER